LPQSKRTSLGLYVTATDAYEKWKADPENVKIIDVRTPEEFRMIGFPEMAERIPLSASHRFVDQVRRVAFPLSLTVTISSWYGLPVNVIGDATHDATDSNSVLRGRCLHRPPVRR
jgi:hypothetical protein